MVSVCYNYYFNIHYLLPTLVSVITYHPSMLATSYHSIAEEITGGVVGCLQQICGQPTSQASFAITVMSKPCSKGGCSNPPPTDVVVPRDLDFNPLPQQKTELND